VTEHATDWAALGVRLDKAITWMIHNPDAPRLEGPAWYAAALQRALDPDTDGRPTLGLITTDEHDRWTAGLTAQYQGEIATLRAAAAGQTDELQAALARDRRRLAAELRDRAHSLGAGRLRQEGVRAAADWLDPDSRREDDRG
jgi:hypothetical protein